MPKCRQPQTTYIVPDHSSNHNDLEWDKVVAKAAGGGLEGVSGRIVNSVEDMRRGALDVSMEEDASLSSFTTDYDDPAAGDTFHVLL